MRFPVVLLLLTSTLLPAQDVRGTILGTVTDSSKASIPGAKVKATNMGTQVTLTATTSGEGLFNLLYLLPGTYRVTVEAKGFKVASRDGLELRTSERRTVDFEMALGSTSETVEVKAEIALLDENNSTIGMTIDGKRVSELPKVGGNPYYLTRISPGIVSSGGRTAGNAFDYGSGSTDAVTNGTRGGSNEVQLDGAPNMFGRQSAFSLPEDLVQEMRVETAAYDAAQGRAAGGTVNVNMKAGTNQLHGTAYFFDSRLRAVPWHTNKFIYDPTTGPITAEKIARNTPSWLHQRWGATASGPLWIPKVYDGRNRTFWSFGTEDLHIKRNLAFTGTMPTEAQRTGDFSALLRLNPGLYQIYDPVTIRPSATAGRFERSPIPQNILPASRISAIAKNITNFWPLPNQAGSADSRSNYYNTQLIDRNNLNFVGRLDHNFSQRHRVFARINKNYRNELTRAFPSEAVGDLPSQEGYGAVLDDVYTFNPSTLLNIRYGWTFQRPYTNRISTGFDITSLGFPAALASQLGQFNPADRFTFPVINIDGGAYTNLGTDAGGYSSSNYHTLGATLTRLKGSHNIRIGAEYRLLRDGGYGFGNATPLFNFANTFTNGPLDNTPGAPIGQGFAAFLLGQPTGGNISVNASRANQSSYTSFYLQDDWKLTKRLTVNLGMRYELESPLTERFNRTVTGFDFATTNPVEVAARANYAANPIPEISPANFRVTGGLLFASPQARDTWRTDRNNFAPRIGLAYRLTNKTVIRTGYGIFFDVTGSDRSGVLQSGFSQSTNLIPTQNNGVSFVATLANPFPGGIQAPPGASQGLRTFLGRAGNHFDPVRPNPYMQRWSMTIQRQLPWKTVAEIGYVGNRGTLLPVTRELNPIPRQYLSTSPVRDQATINFLTANVRSPFSGIADFAGTGLANQNVQRQQLLRPFPQFTGIDIAMPAGFSHYHSLQAQIEKRFSSGVTFQASYTYSKFMEATSYLSDTDSFLHKVVSDVDFPQRLVLSGVYELAIGKGRWIGSGMGRWMNMLAGGWQIEGMYEGQSGSPLGFGNAIFRGNLKDIALPVSERTTDRWFNTNAGFERINANALGQNIRTMPLRFSGVRADGINNLDASFFKNFRINEKYNVQFRMETFNTLNHVQFAAPNTDPFNTNFGLITGERGHGQRQVTFALKLLF